MSNIDPLLSSTPISISNVPSHVRLLDLPSPALGSTTVTPGAASSHISTPTIVQHVSPSQYINRGDPFIGSYDRSVASQTLPIHINTHATVLTEPDTFTCPSDVDTSWGPALQAIDLNNHSATPTAHTHPTVLTIHHNQTKHSHSKALPAVSTLPAMFSPSPVRASSCGRDERRVPNTPLAAASQSGTTVRLSRSHIRTARSDSDHVSDHSPLSSPAEDSDDEDTRKFTKAFARAMNPGPDLAKRIALCDGSDSDKTLIWVRAVAAMPDQHRYWACRTTTGPLQDFVNQSDSKGWKKLAKQICYKFISQDFEGRQERALRELTQRPGESLPAFIYEHKRLIYEAYPKGVPHMKTAVSDFLSSLSDRSVATHIIEQHGLPATLHEAYTLVETRHSSSDFLGPRRHKGKTNMVHVADTPMVAPPVVNLDPLAKAVDKLGDRMAHLESQLMAPQPVHEVRRVNKPPARTDTPPGPCYNCGKQGHWSRDCRAPRQASARHHAPSLASPRTAPVAVKCDRCRRAGHEVRNCRAGPPNRPCYCGGSHWLYDCPEHRATASASTPQPRQGN